MKKLFLSLCLLTLLCLPATVRASSIGGAETIGRGNFSVGVNQDLIFDRDGNYEGGIETDPNATIEMSSEIDKINRTMVKGSYGVTDELDVYVMLGNSNFKSTLDWTWSEEGFDDTVGNFKLDGNNGLAYGIGMKYKKNLSYMILPSFSGDWIAGCDIQYLRHKNGLSGMFNATYGSYIHKEPVTGDAAFGDFHAAPFVAKKIGNFTPYGGIKYSHVVTDYKFNWKNGGTDPCKFKSKNPIGIFLGTTYKLKDSWDINIETSFIDETAISLAGVFKF